ncbi:RING finger protein 207-like [Acanthaster planci]|uniref:RING finger protein 207-like n=1 Tax=Acanthaster planci TaxID=133434 RepID=A0A8B7YU00_ACAPL|nr:RING finger protein 207-like [Acanthaster planci]
MMAFSVSAESVLAKIRECSMCSHSSRQPKVLNCLHSFCLGCLLELRQRQDPRIGNLICRTCGRETEAADEDEVRDLPDDLILRALDGFSLQDRPLPGEGFTCQACDERIQAVSKCMDCDHFLCQECQRAHERLSVMKNHKIYTLAQIRAGQANADSMKLTDAPKCGKHPEQGLRFYCDTCGHLVCKICSDLHHEGHPLIGLPEALDKCKREIAELGVKVKENMAELMSMATGETLKSRKKLDTMFDATKTKISERADKEVAKIREEEQALKQEAERIYADRVKTFERTTATCGKEVSDAGHKLDEVDKLMSQMSCHAVLHLRQRFLIQLQDLLLELRVVIGKQSETASSRLSFLDFEPCDLEETPLGRLLDGPMVKPRLKTRAKSESYAKFVATEDGKWDLQTKIQKFGPTQTGFRWACDVAVFSDNGIVVADNAHKRLIQIPVANSESLVVPQQLPISCSNPVCVEVHREDILLALDGSTVKMFDRKRMYQLVHQFTPGRMPNSKPMSLAVDDDNLIAVGYEKVAEISLHNPDGSLVRRVPAVMTAEHITIGRQRLIYTNWDKKKLVAADYHGNRLFSVDTVHTFMMGNWGPTGVCCGRDGGIYVAVCGLGSSCGEVHHYSPQGKHVGCVVEGCGSPRGIAFAAKGDNLIVAAGDSVQIFHCI